MTILALRNNVLICIIGLLAICYSIVLRSEPAFFSAEILQHYAVDTQLLSSLMLRYQLSLIATLIFAGIFVDYFGWWRIILFGLSSALLGNLLFAYAISTDMLIIGRILTGYAHPFILIGTLKLGAELLGRRCLSSFVGLVFAILLLTPQLLKAPLVFLLSISNWQITIGLINLFGLGLIISLIGLSRIITARHERIAITKILTIMHKYQIWLICLISTAGWMANTFFLNWGSRFLPNIFQLQPTDALHVIKISFLCFAFSGCLVGILADSLRRKHLLIVGSYLVAAVALSVLLCANGLATSALAFLCYLIAITTSTAIICYAKALEFCTAENSGFTFGLVACITTIGNTFFAYLLTTAFSPTPASQLTQLTTWLPMLYIIPIALVIGAAAAAALHRSPKIQK